MTNIISAALVKELRERTGAGMMECKKALEVSKGDLELAIEELRKSGRTKADKKAGRIAAEGAIVISGTDKQVVMLEVNSETDFVSRDQNFTHFVRAVAETAMQAKVEDAMQLSGQTLTGGSQTVEEARLALVAKVGENVQIRRLVFSNPKAAHVGTYLHGNRIGVFVELDIANNDLARDIAMHIAASRPIVVSPDQVSQEVIAKEKEIYMAQAATSGKPQDIIVKMVQGRIKKYLDEVSLLGQLFVKDPNTTVGNLLKQHKANVIGFVRFEVGEGIEKVTEDFKESVMSQVQGS